MNIHGHDLSEIDAFDILAGRSPVPPDVDKASFLLKCQRFLEDIIDEQEIRQHGRAVFRPVK